jgi:type II secretion system protein G
MNKKGFTLVELLIVIAIIGIIAAIAIPNLMLALQRGRQKATMSEIKAAGTAIMSYMVDYSFAPQTASFLGIDSAVANFTPYYMQKLVSQDGWGNYWEYARGAVATPERDLFTLGSSSRDAIFSGFAQVGMYICYTLNDYNYDILYHNGIFVYGPKVKN